MRKTIAIDFDGVIHKYSKGWHDGTIYDEPIDGAFEAIRELMDKGFAVYVLSSRKSWDIIRWIQSHTGELHDEPIPYIFKTEHVMLWHKVWDKDHVLGVTNRKLPAIAYIDDRAIKFENWKDILVLLSSPK